VPAQEALATLAAAYNLVLEQHGTVFTLRPLTGAEQVVQIKKTEARAQLSPLPPIPPVPPVPPIPSMAPKAKDSSTGRRRKSIGRRCARSCGRCARSCAWCRTTPATGATSR
jgi:hypothetical protein